MRVTVSAFRRLLPVLLILALLPLAPGAADAIASASYPTATALTSATNPAYPYQQVSYTATVTCTQQVANPCGGLTPIGTVSMMLTVYAVSPTGALTPAGNTAFNPYSVGFGPWAYAFYGTHDYDPLTPGFDGPYDYARSGVAFSPNGSLIAVANEAGGATGENTADSGRGAIFLFSVGTGNTLTQIGSGSDSTVASEGGIVGTVPQAQEGVPGPCSTCGNIAGTSVYAAMGPESVAFSPNGELLAVGEGNVVAPDYTATSPPFGPVETQGAGAVAIYSVGPKGLVKDSTTVSFPGDADIASVAFSPDGSQLAATDTDVNAISVFSVVATGNVLSPATLTPVSGSPFATGSQPVSVAFSANGQMIAAANVLGSTISVFKSTSVSG